MQTTAKGCALNSLYIVGNLIEEQRLAGVGKPQRHGQQFKIRVLRFGSD